MDPEQLQHSITVTTAAINAIKVAGDSVKAAWDSWAWAVPIIMAVVPHLAALVKGVAEFPGVKWLAGNYGYTK